MEHYIPFLATTGGKCHIVADEIGRERVSAKQARIDYLKSKGDDAIALWGGERAIVSIVYKPGKIPSGWRRDQKLHRKHAAPEGGIFAVPDGKQRETYKTISAELANIPSMPGAEEFTRRIGGSFVIVGMTMRFCWFERIGEALIVMVPRIKTKEEAAENAEIHGKEMKQFIPPDCTELKLSDYYRMKEEHEAAKPAAPSSPA